MGKKIIAQVTFTVPNKGQLLAAIMQLKPKERRAIMDYIESLQNGQSQSVPQRLNGSDYEQK